MRLSEDQCWDRIRASLHGVLGTVHPERGVDLVPVVYAVADDRTIFIPVDTVKAKASTRLQRLENLRLDPRCTLLVDFYGDDWSRLWWVRLNGRGREATADEVQRFTPTLAGRYSQYAAGDSILGGVVVTPADVTGWEASAG
jgi:PPOX class probable F420-dependent enzyme